MEQFRGNLAAYRLALLMPALFEGAGTCGALTLERGPLRRRFTVCEGRLVDTWSSEPKEHLGQWLVDWGLLETRVVADSFEEGERTQKRLGSVLLDGGLLSLRHLEWALAEKARLGLLDCYTWESGEVEFTPLCCNGASAGLGPSLDLRQLHREGLEALKGRLVASRARASRADLGSRIQKARDSLARGACETACALLAGVLEDASVPEGPFLYREAERRHREEVEGRLSQLDDCIEATPGPQSFPLALTTDDAVIYSRLRQGKRGAAARIASMAMGPIAAYKSLIRLAEHGLLRVNHRFAGSPLAA